MNLTWKISAAAAVILFLFTGTGVFAQDMEGGTEVAEGDERGADNVPKRDAFSAWNTYLRGDLPDPLEEPDMTSQEFMERQAQTAARTKAAAEFTDAAATVVTAGLPSPTTASGAATMAIGEAAEGIVEAETTAEPGLGTRIWNGIKAVVSWLNPFD